MPSSELRCHVLNGVQCRLNPSAQLSQERSQLTQLVLDESEQHNIVLGKLVVEPEVKLPSPILGEPPRLKDCVGQIAEVETFVVVLSLARSGPELAGKRAIILIDSECVLGASTKGHSKFKDVVDLV